MNVNECYRQLFFITEVSIIKSHVNCSEVGKTDILLFIVRDNFNETFYV